MDWNFIPSRVLVHTSNMQEPYFWET